MPIVICLYDDKTISLNNFINMANKHNLSYYEILHKDIKYPCAFIPKEILTDTDNVNRLMEIYKDFASLYSFK